MADAPLVGQDGGSHKDDLPDGATGIFFREGQDRFLQQAGDLPVGLICRSCCTKIALARDEKQSSLYSAGITVPMHS